MGRVSDAKERLMEAVRELVWTGSYGSTTIDQICEKAGVKKGSGPAAAPAGGGDAAPAPPKPKKSACGCAPGDLQCAMRCAAG